MEENKEIQNIESGEEMSNGGVDYIEAINKIKQNSVPREQYEKVQQENRELLDTLINGGQITQVREETERSLEDIRKELFSNKAVEKGMSNLEFVERCLELRDAVIESGGTDPFLPVGKGIELTRDDYDAAEFTAEQFRECVEIAKGNSEVFTAELMRRTIDNGLSTAKKNSYYRR